MIRPVSVDDTELCNGGILQQILGIMLSYEKDPLRSWRSPSLREMPEFTVVHLTKPVDGFYIFRRISNDSDRFRLVHGGFLRIHRIDAVMLDRFRICGATSP